MHRFKKITAWQKSFLLVRVIYKSSNNLPDFEKYGMRSQINRSAVSIPSNIAEGAGRDSNKDFRRFLSIAIGSSFELETQLLLCSSLGYLRIEDVNNLVKKLLEVQNLIYGFKKSLKDD